MTMNKKSIMLLVGIGAVLLIILNWDKLMAFAKGGSSGSSSSGGGSTSSGSSSTVAAGSSSSSTKTVTGNPNPSELLRKGSKGATVASLQNMIIDGWGKAYLPRYGADGDFGSETESALKTITGQSSTTLTTFKMNWYDKQKATSSAGGTYTAGSSSSTNWAIPQKPAWDWTRLGL